MVPAVTARMNLQIIKTRQKGAATGHSLLSKGPSVLLDAFEVSDSQLHHPEKKADALTKRFRTITSKIADVRRQLAHCGLLGS